LQWFLTILFESLLCSNTRERVAAATGRNSVCEQRYHGSSIRTQNNNIIEKMVSRNHCKKSILDKNSPFFLHRRFVYGDARETRERRVEILSVGGDIPRRELGTATTI
jgi:hypothetical protein